MFWIFKGFTSNTTPVDGLVYLESTLPADQQLPHVVMGLLQEHSIRTIELTPREPLRKIEYLQYTATAPCIRLKEVVIKPARRWYYVLIRWFIALAIIAVLSSLLATCLRWM